MGLGPPFRSCRISSKHFSLKPVGLNTFLQLISPTHVIGITRDTALRRAVARKQAASQARWLAAHRFGPPHLRQVVRKMAVQIATEKSRGNTTVTVPVHPQFAESLRAARAAGIIGAEVFTGKVVRGRILPMKKKAWAAKFKKHAVLAGINEPKKSCHGAREARAGVAACADYTESQMMAIAGPI